MKLSDPVITDPAIQNGGIDMHAHQDPDSNGPSYGQAARSDDAMDLYTRAKAAGMRGFVIKEHLDQSAGLAYYMRKLHPDMEFFGGVGSNFTTGTKVNPWAIIHMAEMKGGWGRIVWMPSWDSETSSHRVRNYMTTLAPRRAPYFDPPFVSVARCADGGRFWANFPKPCDGGELLPEVKEAIKVIATTKTRDSNGDLILATGHNSPEEDMMMIKEAVRVGVKHIIITHPLLDVVDMTLDADQGGGRARAGNLRGVHVAVREPGPGLADGEAVRRGHSRGRRRPRVRVERYRPDQLGLSARCPRQVREGTARERVHRAGAGEAVQDQSREDSGARPAPRRGHELGAIAAQNPERNVESSLGASLRHIFQVAAGRMNLSGV